MFYSCSSHTHKTLFALFTVDRIPSFSPMISLHCTALHCLEQDERKKQRWNEIILLSPRLFFIALLYHT